MPAPHERYRRDMLDLVKSIVKKKLEQSLHGAAMIALDMEERAHATERPWDMVLQTPDQPNRSIPRGTGMVEVFEEANRSLLILGQPGSGKTTMLLDLARETIHRAEKDEARPIPVVFNLSSWAAKRPSLAEWLVEELFDFYGAPKKIARSWVKNDDLLLLLDGLDEVKAEHRDACIRAINAFREEHWVPLAVCSRTADYEAQASRLEHFGAVVLQPLSPEQIGRYLAGTGPELAAVRKAQYVDPVFRELAQTPLMLDIMTLAYRGVSEEDLKQIDSVDSRRKHLFDTYVQRMFEWREKDHPFPPEQTRRYLAWLARHAQAPFLIERLQPGWLDTDRQRRLYRIGVWLSMGLILGLMGGLVWGLIGGLLVGSLGGLLLGRPTSEIRPVEVLKWDLANVLIFWLVGGLIFGLAVGGGKDGLVGGLIFGLIFGLVAGLRSKEIDTRTTPNQGIWQSARNAVRVTLVVGLSGALVLGLIGGLLGGVSDQLLGGLAGLSVGPIAGLLAGLGGVLLGGLGGGLFFGLVFGGGLPFIQHFILRFILYRSGCLPWNLVPFLDYAAGCIFLRRVGGGYEFVHGTLMEHLASLAS